MSYSHTLRKKNIKKGVARKGKRNKRVSTTK